MYETGKDMQTGYKETSLGGLATSSNAELPRRSATTFPP